MHQNKGCLGQYLIFKLELLLQFALIILSSSSLLLSMLTKLWSVALPTWASLEGTFTASGNRQGNGLHDDVATHCAGKRPSAEVEDAPLFASVEQPSPKRARTTLNPHPLFWDTGLVIIQVQDVSFRLPRRYLEQESNLLQTKFASEPDYIRPDGAVFNLSNIAPQVTSEQFSSLLYFMHDPVLKWRYEDSILRPAAVASRDLGFEDIHKNIILIFESICWPSGTLPISPDTARCDPETCWTALVFSFQHDFPSIRKRAVFDLIRHRDCWTYCKPQANVLSETHILARDCLEAARQGLTDAWVEKSATLSLPSCGSNSYACSKFVETYSLRMHQPAHGLFKKHFLDPIEGLQALIDTPWHEKSCCPSCISLMKTSWEEERKHLWKNLDLWANV
ncbi:hypothetical protein GYMLUDRAFT_934236 [Collybiopsis luxurians FD-317 M1]|nr:hypothetical protein GYMLUDRAFT_934236 [Collybiopsis luxurians FD-317 M1]